ncbi:MAG: outer membrane lipoprotein chaperone LolA [Comamonas sp.]|nr:outer membrane lipoprotein chaperone LolA [Candidatus Comamonas equi]
MKKSLGILAVLGGLPLAVWADGLQSLENFMRTAQAGQAQFTQTVTAPAKDGQPARSKTSSGDFAFQRPGQFKFIYTKPFEQTITADGRTVWLYDVDLNQVTQRNQADALGSTPAAILASANDLSALKKDFALEAVPDADGMQWVQATPKSADGQLKSVRVGFTGNTLMAMDILDGFGQRSVIRFNNLQVLPSLPAGQFRFEIPLGADVLQQ